MTDSLRGPLLKLRRARQHLKSVNAAIQKFIEVELRSKSDRVELQSAENWQWLVWGEVPEADPQIAVMLGDFVHQVRSALDHSIWALVTANDKSARGSHTHFPIKETPNQWRKDIDERPPDRGPAPTSGLSADALELVRNYQPFRVGKKPGPNDALWKLHRISNEDKHRALQTVAVTPTTGLGLMFMPLGYVTVDEIKYPSPLPRVAEGAKIAKVKLRFLANPSERVDVRMRQIQGFGCAFVTAETGEELARDADLPDMLRIARSFVHAARRLPELL